MDDISDIIELPRPLTLHTRSYRYRAVYTLIGGVVGLLLLRSFYLQILQGSDFRSAAEGNRVAARLLTAPRGIIYDVNGLQLVDNVASTDVVLSPARLPSEENESVLIEELPRLLADVSGNDVQEALRRTRTSQRPQRLATALDHDTVLAIERVQKQLPGVELVSSLVRRYHDGAAAAPFLGYTGYVTGDDLDTHSYLVSTDIIGKTGIEKTYDERLHGRHGVSYEEIDAEGVAQKQMGAEEPIAGADLHLSIDMDLQKYITEVFATTTEERELDGKPALTGAVVAIDPRTGAVRALVSYPAYDANVFSQPRLADQTANIIDDERQLLFNRAVSGVYPPGSTIKPFIAAGALAENIISSDTTFLSTGGISVGPWNFPDWKSGGHGVTDVRKAIAESVNTFFYLITGGDAEHTGLGVARTRDYLASFGWGEATRIDVPSEASGFLPTEEWKLATKNEQWYIGDTYHLAIGQSDVLVTPLQVAVSTAAVANDGFVHQPFLVRTVRRQEGEDETIEIDSHEIAVGQADLRVVKEGMRQTVTEGSGRALIDMPIALAGKTGTAQTGNGDETHAWFTSYGPYETPELVITVLLERGGAGDIDAVPVAKKIWQWWADHRR